MKALSIRQPWADEILARRKPVENRSWTACTYRGPILLHASTGGNAREYADAAASIAAARADLGLPETPLPLFHDQVRGGFVGIARIVRVEQHPDAFEGAPGYRIAGHLGLYLEDVRPLPFVRARGALGIYSVEHRPGGPITPHHIDFGEHAEIYAAAWAELETNGGHQ
jgi:hypothetical protein